MSSIGGPGAEACHGLMFVFREPLWLQSPGGGMWLSSPFSRGVSGLEQGENRGGGEEMLDSAYVLKAQPTGLVKGYKMFSLSGQIVNVRPCRPHSLCCSCSALLLKHK